MVASALKFLCRLLMAVGFWTALQAQNTGMSVSCLWLMTHMLVQTWIGWVLTLVVAAFVSAGLTALLLYSPQKTAADDLVSISRALGADSIAMLKQINATGSANAANLKVQSFLEEQSCGNLRALGST